MAKGTGIVLGCTPKELLQPSFSLAASPGEIPNKLPAMPSTPWMPDIRLEVA